MPPAQSFAAITGHVSPNGVAATGRPANWTTIDQPTGHPAWPLRVAWQVTLRASSEIGKLRICRVGVLYVGNVVVVVLLARLEQEIAYAIGVDASRAVSLVT
jgi:hypothetical protein